MTLGAHNERTLADEAMAALRELEAVPVAAKLVGDTAVALGQLWMRRPFVIGIGGELGARTRLFGALSGGMPLDPKSRSGGGGPALRLRAGKVARCVALGDGGALGEVTMPAPDDDPGLRASVTQARTQVGELALHARAAERDVPALVRHRPPVWAIWLWPIRWWLQRSRRVIVEAWRRATERYGEAEREAAAAEARLAGLEERQHGIRSGYAERIERWLGQRGVRELVIEVDANAWPANVELLELDGPQVDADAVLMVDGLDVRAGSELLGGAAALSQQALPIAAVARTLRVARPAVERLALVIKTLDTERLRAERGFAERLNKLEAMRVEDPDDFAAATLAKVRPQVIASTNALMEHAGTHLGASLAELGTRWIAAVSATATSDELKAAIAKIDETAVGDARQIADDVRLLVTGGAAGIAYDLVRAVLDGLRPTGEPPAAGTPKRQAPLLPSVALLPSLISGSTFQLAGGESWLAGLFRSFDTRRNDIHTKVTARIARLREVAEAELLDVEPKLHAAITDALATELATELAQQAEWLDTELRRERFAVAGERGALLPLERALSAARRYHDTLARRIADLESQDPVAAEASR